MDPLSPIIRETFQRYSTLSGGNTLAIASLANIRARAGDRREALRLAAQPLSKAA